MTTENINTDLSVIKKLTPSKLDNSNNRLAKIIEGRQFSDDEVPHISESAIRHMIDIARTHKRNGERDAILVTTLFDGSLRCKEALGIRPRDIIEDADGYFLKDVEGKSYKGNRRIRRVAISPSLASKLLSYAYKNEIKKDECLFNVNRSRVHQIIKALMTEANVIKPEHVGAVHVLRHSGAIERLRHTKNPKAVQDHLGHINAQMTLRYMKTLSKEETLKIEQNVDYGW